MGRWSTKANVHLSSNGIVNIVVTTINNLTVLVPLKPESNLVQLIQTDWNNYNYTVQKLDVENISSSR